MPKHVILDLSSRTIRISDENSKKLVKIGAAESLKDGRDRTPDDVIAMLVKFYEDKKK
jgi:hypothetical protein